MSVGLFGAYTGNPRLQRAYATATAPASCGQGPTVYSVTVDDSLVAALNDPNVTCIEIQGEIPLQADLPTITDDSWLVSRQTQGLTIFGNGDDTIDGAYSHSGIRFELRDTNQPATQDVKLSISDMTLSSFASNFGSAVYAYLWYQPVDLLITLDRLLVSGGTSADYGGAIYAGSKSDQTMVSNTYITVTNSNFSDNTVDGHGGALWAFNTDDTALLDVSTSTFTHNQASQGNGAVALGGAVAVTTDPMGDARVMVGQGTTFEGNSATVTTAGADSNNLHKALGGALYTSGSMEIGTDVTFDNNTVTATSQYTEAHGGAIFASGSIGAGPNTTFSHNAATAPTGKAKGGAIFTNSSLTVTGTQAHPVSFTDDSSTTSGGAIYAYSGGSITSAVLERNTATWGGAVYNHDTGWTFTNTTIADNYVSGWGGGVYTYDNSSVRLYGSAVVRNTAATGSPGGILVNGGSLIAENSFIGSNSATYAGGIWASGEVDLQFSTVYDNTATSSGVSDMRAGSLTATMSVVGSSTSGSIMDIPGTVDDSYSVSTSTNSSADFDDATSKNLPPGQLGLGILQADQFGLTPRADSRLVLAPQDGYAPLVNPLPGIASDQRGFARVAPFTIGARQALTINSVTPSSGESTGGELVTIHGSAFTGTTSAAIGGSALTNLAVVDDTTITGTAPAGTFGDADVTVTDASGTATLAGGFTYVAPTPNPSPPAPSVPASAPRDVRAEGAVESAKVSWLPPASTGSFPVTSYQAVASPSGETCMVAAPALSCTITGLTPGKPYTVTAHALTGAGWSEASSPSSVVVPLGPEVPTILITNSRDRAQKSMARIEGTTTGLVGAEVVPYLRMTGQTDFTPGASTRTVDAQGNFVWQRKAKKRFTVYFVSGDVTSNRLVIRPE